MWAAAHGAAAHGRTSSFGACTSLQREGGVYTSTDLEPWAQNPPLALLGPALRPAGAKSVTFPLPKANAEVIASSVHGSRRATCVR